MLYSLRTIALLMLVAGVSLGIFASTLLAGKGEPAPASLNQWVEERVKLYQADHDLDVAATDAIRRELLRHRRHLWDMMMDLRRQHEAEFLALRQDTEGRIHRILKEASPTDR